MTRPRDEAREADLITRATGFPSRLRTLREEMGWTERDMAERLGLSVRAYRDREKGRRKRIGWPLIVRLAEQTNVSIDWLLLGAMRVDGHLGPRNDAVPVQWDGRLIRFAGRLLTPGAEGPGRMELAPEEVELIALYRRAAAELRGAVARIMRGSLILEGETAAGPLPAAGQGSLRH